MLSRCPGSAKCPVRTTRPHPVLLFYTDAGSLCVSSLRSTKWGAAGGVVVVVGMCYLVYPSPSRLLWVTHTPSIPQKVVARGPEEAVLEDSWRT